MTTKYDQNQIEDIFRTNALAGIPEELTALGLARKHRKEEEWNAALAEWKKQSIYGQDGRSLQDLLADVCAVS